MTETRLFVSYPRTAAEPVRELAAHLERLGQNVWVDQQLSGGQDWWDTILERIRTCDCFMFALCEEALRSKACRAELDYAHRLDRVILPMVVGPPVPDQVLPRYLSKLQRVDAGDPVQVARALLHLPDRRPLPSPLPEPPPVPISYLDELAEVVDRPSLTLTDQRNLVGALKQRLARDDDRDAAITLLHRLRERSDVYAGVADEVDATLATYAGSREVDAQTEPATVTEGAEGPPAGREQPPTPPQHRSPPPPPPPPTAPGRRPTPRGKVAALVAAGVLVVGGVAGAIALAAGGDDDATPTTGPTTTSGSSSTSERPPPVDPVGPVEPTPGLPVTYGDDPYFDDLADYCYGGSFADCDALYRESPADSAYSAFGSTCGALSHLPLGGACAVEFDGALEDLVVACDGGDMLACDDLYWESGVGSLYEAFAAYCGLRTDTPLPGECEVTLSA